jgi:hypothetical protein
MSEWRIMSKTVANHDPESQKVGQYSDALIKLVVAFGVLVYIGGCSDHKPGMPTPTERRIFVGGIDYSQSGPARSEMFIFDFDSLSVIDSLALPERSVDAVAGKDERCIYFLTMNDLATRSVVKIDPGTKGRLWTHDVARWPDTPPGRGRLVPLKGASLLVANREIISGDDGSVVKTIPDSMVPFDGLSSGSCVAIGTITQGDNRARALHGYNVVRDSTWGSYTPHLENGTQLLPYCATLHPDLRRVLAIGIVEPRVDSAWFVIGDLGSGQTLLQFRLSYPFGEILITPDGTRALVSDPSRTLIFSTWPTLDLFDLDSLQHLNRLMWAPGQTTELVYASQLVSVGGQDEIMVAPPGDLNSVGPMAIVNARTLEVIQYFRLPGKTEMFEYFMGGMTTAVVPSRR